LQAQIVDHNSYTSQAAVSTHASLELTADFGSRTLSGFVTHTVEVQADTTEYILDSRELTIHSAVLLLCGAPGPAPAAADGTPRLFTVGASDPANGAPVVVSIPEAFQAAGSKFKVRIGYTTAAGDACTAAQWLPAEQTAGKKHPYLFTQCQAIHARSLFPCNDTCSAKFTYDATVTVPAPLLALMSAVPTGNRPCSLSGPDSHTTYCFHQKIPIPAYLVAIVAGDLEERAIGPRSSVWSEPSMVDAAAFEFAETEQYIQVRGSVGR
jgi:leukotriene-A4 hydrolase